MANLQFIDVREDGPINAVIDAVFTLPASGGSDVAYQILIDPSDLGYIDTDNTYKANELRPLRIIGNCSDGLEVQLYFDAPTPLLFETFNGRLDVNYRPRFGSKQNKAVSATGSIGIQTVGYQAGTALNFTLTIEMLKIRRRSFAESADGPLLAFNTASASQYIPLFGRG